MESKTIYKYEENVDCPKIKHYYSESNDDQFGIEIHHSGEVVMWCSLDGVDELEYETAENIFKDLNDKNIPNKQYIKGFLKYHSEEGLRKDIDRINFLKCAFNKPIDSELTEFGIFNY